jgi:diaminohydroxyphosphoribosylaminopyrimidine deaminase/5-amino-6-(5-phosphoribosylamino)uracil reductase
VPNDFSPLELQMMRRCLQLAALGAGAVAPNPMVGAVLVYEGRIIGEGWHRQYGGPHAEIDCLASVREADKPLIPHATIFVSLEPCAHYGKTPPCSLRIIQERIPEVVIACSDPFPAVDGKGIEQLRQAGVRVRTGALEQEAIRLNRRFFTLHREQRPYFVLKWAETLNGKISGPGGASLAISGELTRRLVHRWRSEEAAIMVGRRTVEADDPALTTRCWIGRDPVRIIADSRLQLSRDRRVFAPGTKVIVLNTIKEATEGHIHYIQLPDTRDPGPALRRLADLGIQSILVEGGAALLSSFMRYGYADEVRRIVSGGVRAADGTEAPVIPQEAFRQMTETRLGADTLTIFERKTDG